MFSIDFFSKILPLLVWVYKSLDKENLCSLNVYLSGVDFWSEFGLGFGLVFIGHSTCKYNITE